jgi:hypothetical protein
MEGRWKHTNIPLDDNFQNAPYDANKKKTLRLMDLMKTTSTSHETAFEPSCMMNVCTKKQCMENTTKHVTANSSQPVTQLIAERTLQ